MQLEGVLDDYEGWREKGEQQCNDKHVDVCRSGKCRRDSKIRELSDRLPANVRAVSSLNES